MHKIKSKNKKIYFLSNDKTEMNPCVDNLTNCECIYGFCIVQTIEPLEVWAIDISRTKINCSLKHLKACQCKTKQEPPNKKQSMWYPAVSPSESTSYALNSTLSLCFVWLSGILYGSRKQQVFNKTFRDNGNVIVGGMNYGILNQVIPIQIVGDFKIVFSDFMKLW